MPGASSAAANLRMGCGATNGWQAIALKGVAVESARDIAAVKANPKPQPTSGHSSSDFEAWWQTYPRKVGRFAAEKSYEKARKRAQPEELLAGAEAYRRETQGREAQYICHPSTWLNQGRWLDETSSVKTTGAISPSRSEWVCRHTPHCGNRTTCAVVSSRTCEHEPLCQSREACMTRTLEGWQ
jgi:hypothetical protein